MRADQIDLGRAVEINNHVAAKNGVSELGPPPKVSIQKGKFARSGVTRLSGKRYGSCFVTDGGHLELFPLRIAHGFGNSRLHARNRAAADDGRIAIGPLAHAAPHTGNGRPRCGWRRCN
jgi:hypothetical protein